MRWCGVVMFGCIGLVVGLLFVTCLAGVAIVVSFGGVLCLFVFVVCYVWGSNIDFPFSFAFSVVLWLLFVVVLILLCVCFFAVCGGRC